MGGGGTVVAALDEKDSIKEELPANKRLVIIGLVPYEELVLMVRSTEVRR